MIDAEQLLGKILAGAMQGGSRRSRRRQKASDNLMGSLLGGLTSGKGLLTAIGLGIGAYEILKQQGGPNILAGNAGSPPGSPPPLVGAEAAMGLPEGVGGPSVPPPIPGQPAVSGAGSAPKVETAVQQLAVRLIQVMVAAAHADGRLDQDEEKRILEKLQEQGLTVEEKQFLLAQMHQPQPIDQLVAGVEDAMVAQTMYSLAASTIVIDTEEERRWLDQLAEALSLSKNMQRFIETEL